MISKQYGAKVSVFILLDPGIWSTDRHNRRNHEAADADIAEVAEDDMSKKYGGADIRSSQA